MTEPPEDHTDLAAVTQWIRDTVEAQESKGSRYIMIPIMMMHTLLWASEAVLAHATDKKQCPAGDGWRCIHPEGHRGPHVDKNGRLYG